MLEKSGQSQHKSESHTNGRDFSKIMWFRQQDFMTLWVDEVRAKVNYESKSLSDVLSGSLEN